MVRHPACRSSHAHRGWPQLRAARLRRPLTLALATALSQPISFIFLISRQGKVRLSKFYETVSAKERTKLTREVAALVLNRCAARTLAPRSRM